MNDTTTLKSVFRHIETAPCSSVLDVGCGNLEALLFLKDKYNLTGKLTGIDRQSKNFESPERQKELGITLIEADVSEHLPFADDSFELIFHKDVLECIPDIDSHIRELYRVLKKGGTIVCAHRDWETIALNSHNKQLINKAVFGYANYLQSGWMDACDGWIGRRVYGYFQKTGLFDSAVFCINEIETEYLPGTKGYGYVQGMMEMIKPNGFLTQEEANELLDDIRQTYEQKEYLFSYPLYVYQGVKL